MFSFLSLIFTILALNRKTFTVEELLFKIFKNQNLRHDVSDEHFNISWFDIKHYDKQGSNFKSDIRLGYGLPNFHVMDYLQLY